MVEMENEFRIPLNQRVALRDGIESTFYGGLGCVGNEGWIRNQRKDKYGFTQVYVEWDRDHWADNGAPDGWTWEGHFDIAEEEPMPEKKSMKQQIVDAILAIPDDDESEVTPEAPTDDDRSSVLEEAIQMLGEADSFAVVSLQRHDVDGVEDGVLIPRVLRYFGSPEGEPLLLLQFSGLGAEAHQALALEAAAEFLQGE